MWNWIKNQNEKDEIINSINRLKPQKDNEVNQYLDYILEMGNMSGDLNNKNKRKKILLIKFYKRYFISFIIKRNFIKCLYYWNWKWR